MYLKGYSPLQYDFYKKEMKMSKQIWKPSVLLNPVPLVMVSCMDKNEIPNIITLGWTGTINTHPPMLSISVRPERHSYGMIKESGEFVVNLVTKELTKAADFCGVKSGRDIDKFKYLNLTQDKASKVNTPIIKESPINIECKVTNSIALGSHELFLAEIKAVQVEEKLLDSTGKLNLAKAELICYSHGEYYELGNVLGYFGYSITKNNEVLQKRLGKNKRR